MSPSPDPNNPLIYTSSLQLLCVFILSIDTDLIKIIIFLSVYIFIHFSINIQQIHMMIMTIYFIGLYIRYWFFYIAKSDYI